MSDKRIIQITLTLVMLVACFTFPRGAAAGGCGPPMWFNAGTGCPRSPTFGVTLSALYAANPWVSYYRYIFSGQVLTIPGGFDGGPYFYCGPTYSAYYGYYYVVCRGDTLLGIALYYGERLSYIQWHNHIVNADRIYAGQFIFP
jgi:hypothetical protein